MAFFVASITYILLFNGLVRVTIGNEIPIRCSGTTAMYCYPVIPSFVHFYGWNFPNVERLHLNNGYGLQWTLRTLPVDLFNWASNIKHLQLYNVGLEALKCDVFQPLKNSLSVLNMNSNLFREFPSCVLKNLNQLETIYFSNQNIESANINDLELNSLKYISLRQNKISNFSISNINNNNDIQIFLDYNKISYLNIFGVNRILYLYGKENQISEINRGIFHSSHSNLIYLELSYNVLDDDVWNILEGVTSLETLKLKQNKLHTVRPSVLNRLSALKELDLSHNYITSFADVLLRSGKMRNVLLNSNTLLNFPSNVIDGTNFFGSNYDCTIDISNNRMDYLQLDIPTTCTRFTLNLGQNELTAIHFKTNDKEIESLNISGNHLVTLPETLPKAKRYIISNNPLMTTNVLKHLTTTMKDATQIEMDGIHFLCNRSEHYDFTNLQLSKIGTFFLRRNCIQLPFLCHIGNSNINIYLDHNKIHYNAIEDMPCELQTEDFNIVSFSGSRMNETFVDLFMSKYTKTISHVTSLYLKKSQIRELSFIRYATVSKSRYSTHALDFSENFLEVFNGLEIITHPYYFTLNIEHNQIMKIEKITIKRTDPIYYEQYIFLKYMNNSIARVNDSLTLIEVVGGSRGRSIYVSVDLSLNRIHILDLAEIVMFNNDNSRLQVHNLNVSRNDLEEFHNCLQNKGQLYVLDLTYNQIRDIPDNSCRYGYYTYLGHNSITAISKTLPTVSTSILDLEWNLIQYITEKAFINMTYLRSLNLRGNKLKNFPKAVQKLRYLTTLDISNNQIINIKQSDIDEMNSLTSLILTGNELTSNPSTSIGLMGPVPRLELKDNLINCECDVLFLRNATLNTHGRCSLPPEYEGYLISCFPTGNCVGNVPMYIYKETKLRCLNDDYFDIKISVSEDDENRFVKCKRIGPKKQKSLRMIAYSKEIMVKEILVNETDQTYYFVFPSSLNADRLCIHAFLEERSYKRCLDVNSTYIISTDKSGYVSETNNGAVYGTSAALVPSVLMNIFGSIFIFAFIKRRKTRSTNEANSNRFDNNAYVPNEYELSSCRRGACDQQLEVYDELSENCYNNGKETYENMNIGNVRT